MLYFINFRYHCSRGGANLCVDYSVLGKRIAYIRHKKGMTQEGLAECAELSTVYISHIENSRSIPSLETLMKLCAALAAPAYHLVVEQREMAELARESRPART